MGRKKSVSNGAEKSDLGIKPKYKIEFNKFDFTPKQKEFLKIAFDKNTKIVFLNGVAGTAKSFLATYAALQLYNMQNGYEDIVFTRTIAESADKGLGSLPGPQPLYSKILTSNGWVKMGDIKENDFVLSWDGSESKVIGVFPKGKKRVFEITTVNGKKARCCEDHLWQTTTLDNKTSVKSLKEIRETFYVDKRLNHRIPCVFSIAPWALQEDYIRKIDFVEETDVQCILIDHEDHLYITDDYLVTHNTLEEKFDPFIMPLMDKLEELVSTTSSKMLLNENIISAIPVNYLRGASWKNKIVFGEECQNFSTKELITLITRIGENTKYFLCGDPMQSDINGKSGFAKICSVFDNEESKEKGIHIFKFGKEDIMRSEILKFIVDKLENLDKKI